jgi:hypothetical protein
MNSGDENYLWQFMVPRWNSAIGLALSAAISFVLIGLLVARGGRPGSIPITGIVWVIAALSLYGVFAFGRWVLRPPITMAATENGFSTFARADRADHKSPGFLIPWPEIQSFSYESYVTVSLLRVHALLVHLRQQHSAMPMEKLSLRNEPDTIYLSVWSKSAAEKTVEELSQLHQRFSSNRL